MPSRDYTVGESQNIKNLEKYFSIFICPSCHLVVTAPPWGQANWKLDQEALAGKKRNRVSFLLNLHPHLQEKNPRPQYVLMHLTFPESEFKSKNRTNHQSSSFNCSTYESSLKKIETELVNYHASVMFCSHCLTYFLTRFCTS